MVDAVASVLLLLFGVTTVFLILLLVAWGVVVEGRRANRYVPPRRQEPVAVPATVVRAELQPVERYAIEARTGEHARRVDGSFVD